MHKILRAAIVAASVVGATGIMYIPVAVADTRPAAVSVVAVTSAAPTPTTSPDGNGWGSDLTGPTATVRPTNGNRQVFPGKMSARAGAVACPTVTVTDVQTAYGWAWRTTRRVCNQLVGGYDCIKVDRYNPAAVPDTVALMPEACVYSRLR